MLRYITLIWNTESARQAQAAQALAADIEMKPGWRRVQASDGVNIFCFRRAHHRGQLHTLPGSGGAIVGAIFSRSGSNASVDAELEAETPAIVADAGRRLVERFWGCYVAFIVDRATVQFSILRSPMSLLPCFTSTYEGVRVFFSRVEDVAALRRIRFTVNWTYIAAELSFAGVRGRLTSLDQVTEIMPGECMRLDLRRDRAESTLYWNPAVIVQQEGLEDFASASVALRSTVCEATRAWYAQHSSVVHKLSGGFDSAVVLASATNADGGPRVTCMNDYSSGCDGDERVLARLTARQLGYELVEHARDTNLRLGDSRATARTVFPASYFLTLSLGRPAVALCRQRGASAISDGSGGDEVFFRSPIMPASADHVLRRGVRRGLFQLALGIARVERTSVWKVLCYALARGFGLRNETYWSIYDTLKQASPGESAVDMDAVRELCREEDVIHPWFSSAERVPPGKLWQMLGLVFKPYEDAFSESDDPDDLSPLLSQPVVELCLRIPTYIHVHGGWPRAVARAAFATDLPPQILNRTSKGGMEDYATAVLRRNFEFVRTALLEGELVRRKLLNRTVLEAQLAEKPSKSAPWSGYLVSDYLSLECWLSSWSTAGA